MITHKRKDTFISVGDQPPVRQVTFEKLTGAEILDQAVAEPTMDRYLDLSPRLNSRVDYEELVRILQRKRAIFITAEQKRKEPKIEGEEVEQTQD